MPALNGIDESVTIQWPGDVPYSPIARRVEHNGQEWYLHEDGSVTCYSTQWEAFRDAKRRRLLAVRYEDVTQRKRVERALRTIARGVASQGFSSIRDTIAMVNN